MENIFDTSVLVQVVPNLKTSQNWLLDRFFPNVVTYETEEVAIDVDVGLRRMMAIESGLKVFAVTGSIGCRGYCSHS